MKIRGKPAVLPKAIQTAALVITLNIIFGSMKAWAGNPFLFYNYTFTGQTGSLSGQFKIQSPGSGLYPYTIMDITGSFDGFNTGVVISSLLIPGAYGNNDNLFSPTNIFLSSDGVSFMADGDEYRIYYQGEGEYGLTANSLMDNGSLVVSLSN